jgi:hypothetical protein
MSRVLSAGQIAVTCARDPQIVSVYWNVSLSARHMVMTCQYDMIWSNELVSIHKSLQDGCEAQAPVDGDNISITGP